MELTEENLTKYMPQIKQACEEFKIDKIADVVKEIKEEFKEISDKYEAKGQSLPEIRYFNKAFGKVCAHLGTFDGERFNLLIFGYTQPKDWNLLERTNTIKAWHSGDKAQANLKGAGKIATMPVRGKQEVVSEIKRWGVTSDKKYFVIAGKILEGEEDPIPIDTNPFWKDGKTVNKRHTYPLNPRWNINIHGLAMVDDDFKQFEASIYGDLADPTSEKFLPKVAPAFKSYKTIAGVDEQNKNTNIIKFNFINAIEVLEEKGPMEKTIYNLADSGHIISYKKVKGEVAEEDKNKLFIVDMNDIVEFHEEVMCQRDDKDNIIKTKKFYDSTYWDRFGIGVFYLTKRTLTKNGNFAMGFRDWTNATNKAFSNEVTQFFEINDAELPHEVFVSFRTNRKPTRWDVENKVEIEDHINGDVTLGNLMGLTLASTILDD